MANPVVESDVRGTVRWFDADKGFGFLAPDAGGDGERRVDVFVHASAFAGQEPGPIKDGERVVFDLALDTQGLQAVNVRRAG